MDLRQLKKDVQCRAVSLELLFEIIVQLDRRLRRLEAEEHRLRERLGKSEPEVLKQTSRDAGVNSLEADGSLHYSQESEERRRGKRRAKPVRQGRVSTKEKLASAERIEDLFPEGAGREDCTPGPERVLWRIEQGQAVCVGDRRHRSPEGRLASVPDVLPQGDFDLQIVVALASLTYILRLLLGTMPQAEPHQQDIERSRPTLSDDHSSGVAAQRPGKLKTRLGHSHHQALVGDRMQRVSETTGKSASIPTGRAVTRLTRIAALDSRSSDRRLISNPSTEWTGTIEIAELRKRKSAGEPRSSIPRTCRVVVSR